MNITRKRLFNPEKLHNFCDLNWTKFLFVSILYSLSFSSAGKAGEEDAARAEDPFAGVGTELNLRVDDAALADEVARLRREVDRLAERQQELERTLYTRDARIDRLERELFEALDIINRQNEKLKRWQTGVAGLFAAEAAETPGGREDRLIRVLDAVSSSGLALAVATAEFCREIDSSLGEWGLSQVQRAQIKLKLGQLAAKSRQFSALADWNESPGELAKCRILEVNRDLGFVTLPVGTASGAFNGLVYRVTGKEGVVLTLVSVRPFVAAAMVTEGSVDELAAGMEAVTEPEKNTETE